MLRLFAGAAALLAVCSIAFSQPVPQVRRVEKGNLVLENIPDPSPALRERLRLYQAARGAVFLDFPADGRGILVQTRFGETNQLHKVDAPLGMRRQVSFYDEPVNSAVYRPGKWPKRELLFSRDYRGNELFQLYLLNEQNGDVVRISDGKTRNTSPVFSRDGKWVAWASSPADAARSKILVADASAPLKARVVLEEDGTWAPGAFAADGLTLAVTRTNSANDQQIWLVDVTNSRKAQIKPSPVKVFRAAPVFSPDAKSLYYISDDDSEFRHVARYNLQTDDEDPLTNDIPWDVEALELSPNGRTLAFAVNEAGSSRLYTMNAGGGRKVAGPKLAPGELENIKFASDSARIGFTLNGTAGRDAFVWNVGRGAPVKWTDSEVGGLDKAAFVEPQLVEYDTFDEVDGKKRRISAFVYKPKAAGRAPVLLSIHGGPELQFRPGFNPFVQYLVQELKVAVVAPNVRGSAGYGKYFVELDNGPRRMDSVKDIGATLDWIGAQSDLDARRVAVYGGSYGGFMAYASLIEYGDRLSAGISAAGISNFLTFLSSTSGYGRDLRRAEYGDDRDGRMREYLQRISPLTNVARIKKPMLIIAGGNDPRVPAAEAGQMLKAIRAQRVEAWYMLAKDEGHGYQKKTNRDAQSAAIATFVKLKLLGQAL